MVRTNLEDLKKNPFSAETKSMYSFLFFLNSFNAFNPAERKSYRPEINNKC